MEVARALRQLFPKHVFVATYNNLPNSWCNEETITKLKELKYRTNEGNLSTEDTYVLERPEFKNIKDAAQKELDGMFKDFIPEEKCKLRITQSWVNITEGQGYHPFHPHPNSFMSGVIYFKTSDDDAIWFKDHQNLTSSRVQLVQDSAVKHPVQAGQIIMFDSDMAHGVMPSDRKEERISLAFNTFPTGTIGDAKGLTELRL